MLDCVEQHTAYVYDRGGTVRLWELGKINFIRYERVRDDISDAEVRLTMKQCREAAAVLDQIEPMRHELVIYRNDQREWEGPITLITETRLGMTINARDVMYYAAKTALHNAYNNAYPNTDFVVERARLILATEIAQKEAREALINPDLPSYNILPYIEDHQTLTDAKTSASTKAFQYKVWEHIDSLAANSGLDYTVVGRSIHLWDTHKALGYAPTVTEHDFLGNLIISRYGSQLATRAYVTGRDGAVGDAGTIDDYYGEMESLTSAYDEDTDSDAPTQAELDSQAARNLVGNNPVPVVVRVPDNSSLNPKGVLSFSDLVPGVYIPLRATLLTRTYTQMQKLDRVAVEEDEDGETIKITLSPAAKTDEPEE